MIDQAVLPHHVEEREGKGGVGAWTKLQMDVRGSRGLVADRVDHDDLRAGLRRSFHEDFVLMRSGVRWIGAPDHDAARVLGGTGIEARKGCAEREFKGRVSGLVAHGVGIDFRCAHSGKQAKRKSDADQSNRAGIVGMHDRVSFAAIDQTA